MSTQLTHNVHTVAPKSDAEQFKSSLISFGIIIGLYYIIASTFKVMVAPFKGLFISDVERCEKAKEIAIEKADNRDRKRMLFKHSDGNFITVLRQSVTDPFKFSKFSMDCAQISFDAYKNGTYLDPELDYAPDIYLEDYKGKKYVNNAFLDYLSNEMNKVLVDASEDEGRRTFLKTINDYYPEFTPKFSVIPSEIEGFREESLGANLTEELIQAIMSKGLSKDVAIRIIESSRDPETIKELIAQAKVLSEMDFCEEMINYCVNKNFKVDHPLAPAINNLFDAFGSDIRPIADAVRFGYIDADELTAIMKITQDEFEESGSENPLELRENLINNFKAVLSEKAKEQYTL